MGANASDVYRKYYDHLTSRPTEYCCRPNSIPLREDVIRSQWRLNRRQYALKRQTLLIKKFQLAWSHFAEIIFDSRSAIPASVYSFCNRLHLKCQFLLAEPSESFNMYSPESPSDPDIGSRYRWSSTLQSLLLKRLENSGIMARLRP